MIIPLALVIIAAGMGLLIFARKSPREAVKIFYWASPIPIIIYLLLWIAFGGRPLGWEAFSLILFLIYDGIISFFLAITGIVLMTTIKHRQEKAPRALIFATLLASIPVLILAFGEIKPIVTPFLYLPR